jgi:hypothetical protein
MLYHRDCILIQYKVALMLLHMFALTFLHRLFNHQITWMYSLYCFGYISCEVRSPPFQVFLFSSKRR